MLCWQVNLSGIGWTETAQNLKQDVQTHPHTERSIERVWWTKFQSSLLNIYFHLSGFRSSFLVIHFRYGPNSSSHCTKVRQRTYAICDSPLSRSAQRTFTLTFTPKTPFLCVNRSAIRYDSRAGAKATRYNVKCYSFGTNLKFSCSWPFQNQVRGMKRQERKTSSLNNDYKLIWT